MRITKIEKQKSNPSRKSVFVDGEFAFGISANTLVKFSLREDAVISEADIESIITVDSEESAKQKALRFLSPRPRSEKEMCQYLKKKGYGEKTIRAVTEQLTELRLLDDREFARMFCRDKLRRKPIGQPFLRQLLMQKGISRSITGTVLSEFFTEGHEEELALSAATSRRAGLLRSSRKLDDLQIKKKVYDYLLRRGFSAEAVGKATSQIFPK